MNIQKQMWRKNDIIENILVCGYVRKKECTIQIQIPHEITTIISFYCKEYIILMIGSNKSIKCINFECMKPNSDTLQHSEKQIYEIMHNKSDRIMNITYGLEHKLFLTLKGNVYGLGENGSGQLGLGENIEQVNTPTLIPFSCKIKAIACGNLHSLFINEDGKLLVCGYNYCGQLGIDSKEIYNSESDGTDESDESDSDYLSDLCDAQTRPQFKPIYNEYFDDLNIRFKHISCGALHSLCITTEGECFTFGHNGFGALGNGKSTEWGIGIHIPHKLEINKTFTKGSCGENYSILLSNNNEIIVFGNNRNNQCSIMKQNQFDSPYILSKQTEFGISENYFVEEIICKNDTTKLIIDVYKRSANQKFAFV